MRQSHSDLARKGAPVWDSTLAIVEQDLGQHTIVPETHAILELRCSRMDVVQPLQSTILDTDTTIYAL